MNQGDKTKDIMAQTTDQMLSLALEIEGLILLIQRRGDLVHPGVNDILREKIAALASLAGVGSADAAAVELPIEVVGCAPCSPCEPIADVNATSVSDDAAIAASEEFETAEDAGEECVSAPEEPAEAPEVMKTVEAPVSPEPVTIADARPSFTLNDRFLYRNELFDGDDAAFNEALDVIATMSTQQEVAEYLTEDLCLDADNPTVRSFLEAVSAGK